MKPIVPLLLLASFAAAACTRTGEAAGGDTISREQFVAANVAVRLLPDSAPQARRDSALEKTGVTEGQLRAWVTLHARDPELLAGTWEEIAFKVDSVAGTSPLPDGVPPEGSGAPPPVIDAPVAAPPPPAPEMNARTQIRRALEPPPPPLDGAEADRPRPRRKPSSVPSRPSNSPPPDTEPQPPVQ